jgi:porin
MKLRYRLIASLIIVASCPLAFSQEETIQDTTSGSESRSAAGAAPRAGVRFGGPTSVQVELEEDRIDTQRDGLERWNGWKDDLYERYGLRFSIEYNSLMQWLSPSAIDDDLLGGGNARLFGSWTLLGKDTKNPGSLVFRVDNRHAYTDLDPQNGSLAAGSGLPTGSLFSGREWGLVNLQWSQTILDGRGGFIFGMTPADDYFHAYAMANPLTAFSNLAFSIGGEVAIPDSGLGFAAGTTLGDHLYWKGGVHDANGSSSDPNLDVLGDWELYSNLEIGWTSAQDKLYLDNFHLGVWHADERSEAGVPEDWGLTANASWFFEDSRLLPFLRGGWSDGKSTLLDAQISAGLGKQFRERDLAGVGVSWGSPSGDGLRDQWTSELFYRIQWRNIAITPSIQLIGNPTSNPDEDAMVVGGLRARIVF